LELRQRRERTLEPHAREAVQPDLLDQGHDLWLGAAQEDLTPAVAQAPGKCGEIEHQGGVGKHQPAEIHDHVGLCSQSTDKRPSTASLSRLVFVSAAAQCGWLFAEVDDPRKLPKPPDRWQPD
jgi:hypothetical protein